MKQTIYLKDYFKNKISSRSSVEQIFSKLKEVNSNNIILDFSDITNISRSAAHQFIREWQSFTKDKNMHIEWQSMNDNVKQMIEIAQNPNKRIYNNYNTIKFENSEQFYEYLNKLNT